MSRKIDPTVLMWEQACDFIAEAERMHQQFFRLTTSLRSQALWEPPVDVFEDEREVVIVVALPGVEPERLELASEPGALLVRAERPFPLAGSEYEVRQLEIPYGYFQRRIPLPVAALELGSHELARGCLVVRLRKIA
jgi:HSP20 family molecular chaperone IbpA